MPWAVHARLVTRTIAIIDTGYDTIHDQKYSCGNDVDLSGNGMQDELGHGRFVNRIINETLPRGYCVTNVKLPNPFNVIDTIRALESLVNNDISYLNISVSGPSFIRKEFLLISTLISQGTKIFVSASNEGIELSERHCNVFPACYALFSPPGLFVVGALDYKGNKLLDSNFGAIVKHWELGIYTTRYFTRSGTSFAAPRALLRHLKEQ